MNQLLAHYCVDVRHSEVSGAEHLDMLKGVTGRPRQADG